MAKYDDAFKAGAVILLQGAGHPDDPNALDRVHRKLYASGVSKRSLKRWFAGGIGAPPDKVVQQEKKDVSELMGTVLFGFMSELVRRLEEGELEDAPLNHVLQGMGIAFDKVQLLEGKPTSRAAHEVSGKVEHEIADARERLADRIAQYAARHDTAADISVPN